MFLRILLCLLGPVSCEWSRSIQKAQKLMVNKDFSGAISILDNFLLDDPLHPQALMLKFNACCALGLLKEAEQIEATLLSEPTFSEWKPLLPRLAKGWMDTGFRHTQRAVDRLRAFVEDNPTFEDVPMYLNLGMLLGHLDELDEAERVYRAALGFSSSPPHEIAEVRAHLASLLLFRGRAREAKELLEANAREGRADPLTVMRLHDMAASALRNSSSSSSPPPARPPAARPVDALEYRGFTIPAGSSYAVPRIDVDQDRDGWFWRLEKTFARHVTEREPLVIRTTAWHEVGLFLENWSSDEYLLRQAGDELVYVDWRSDASTPYGFQGPRVLRNFSEVIRTLQAQEDGCDSKQRQYYLHVQRGSTASGVYKPPLVGNLKSDVPPPTFLSADLRERMESVNLWMGNTGGPEVPQSSRMHHDRHDNLLAVIEGSKRAVLFSPADLHRMYTAGRPVAMDPRLGAVKYADGAQNAHFSHVHPDLVVGDAAQGASSGASEGTAKYRSAHFPAFESARSVEVELLPGDMLYLPTGWFHLVSSYGKHTAVNFWWHPLIPGSAYK